MGARMKTTIEISDDLLNRAKKRARTENKTLREIVEEALRHRLTSPQPKKSFTYRPHTFKGKGLQPGLVEGDWAAIRDLIYKSG